MDLSDAVLVDSSRLKSVVWNDFDRVKKGDTFVAICRHCKKKLSGSSNSGTSHLRNHLIRCQRKSNHNIGQYVVPRGKKKDSPVLPLATFNNLLDQEAKKDDHVLNLVNVRLEQEHMRGGDDHTVHVASYNFDQQRSRFDLARMIILHGYPLAMVEHIGFRVFVKNLQPLFDLVTVNRAEEECVEIYVKEKQKVSELLDKLPGKISLSAGLWTNSNNNSEYLCLTSHYIDESWQLRKKVLNFILLDPSHTEDVHTESIMSCLMDWDIDRKLFSMTFDNDNILSRIRDRLSQNRFLYCKGKLFDVKCVVNVLHMMARDCLEALSGLTHKVRESFRYVKSSQETQAKFSEMAGKVGVPSQKCFALDNQFQWDSTYLMIRAALEYREVFSLLQENDTNYSSCPSDTEWETLGAITSFLKLFYDVTNVLARTKSGPPTSNIYFPELCDIYLQLIEWCKNSSDDYISTLTLKMRTKFEEYWEKCSLGLAVSTMLDPRFKMKLVEYYYPQIYGTTAQERINDVFDFIKELYNEHSICLPLASIGLDDDDSDQMGGKDSSRDRLMGFDKFINETSQNEGVKSDLDKYLEEPLFPRNVDFSVLNWWKVHTPRYPILSMMARNLLGVLVSKLTGDSAFKSGGGRVIDREWSLLGPGTIQILMCSQDWLSSELESN